MRPIALILAAFAFSASAFAQSWKEYSYPEYAISVAFPTNPQIETGACLFGSSSQRRLQDDSGWTQRHQS